MKIVYIYLCGPFSDGWNYQENQLPKAYKKLGHDVTVITSSYSLDKEGKDVFVGSSNYIDENGVRIVRLPLKKGRIRSRFKRFSFVFETLNKEKPDFIFLHSCQFLDSKTVAEYAAKNHVKIVVDNHADFGNSGKGFVSKNILHGIIWKSCAKKFIPLADKFYGSNKARLDFWKDIYGVPDNKLELLLIGADDDLVLKTKDIDHRENYGYSNDDFLLVTGGKYDSSRERILDVMKAIKLSKNDKIKLLVFGPSEDEFKQKIEELADGDKVKYLGWQEPEKSFELFSMADIAIFPCLHSVFWEQSASLSKPLIVNKIPGISHIDAGGNIRFITDEEPLEIAKIIEDCANPETYRKMKEVAESVCDKFLYSKIAEGSLL